MAGLVATNARAADMGWFTAPPQFKNPHPSPAAKSLPALRRRGL